PPATFAGKLLPAIGEEVGLPDVPLTAVAEHDTASAVVAVPSDSVSFAYLSCGTWSLLGTEVTEPVLSEQALAWNVTNEGGIGGTTRLLKNITGLWLLQECRRTWRSAGQQISYEDEAQLIAQAEPFLTFIDPDDPLFASPGSMPELIQQYCRQRGQRVPDTMGAILRCIIESLAMKHRFVLERIEQLVGQRFGGLHVVGGGVAHESLCQWTANALARPVWAGPQEATAIGNVLVQLMALGYIQDLQQARQVVRTSFEIKEYEPAEAERWEEAYQRFLTVIER
ncbi:MAG: rhamnulokinase, partial [Ktedonobacteraceae bacterium]|nr:rhamnulokinase [Ktedonobacteraceae bacterium]